MLVIVGYQAHGTLGREIFDGAGRVKIFNNDVLVRCAVKAIGALSAHADQNKIVEWIGSGSSLPEKVFCVHGEEGAANALAKKIFEIHNVETSVPRIGDVFEV